MGALLAVIAAVAASIAWSNPSEGRIKLEGAWIGETAGGGVQRLLLTYSPLDPSGQSAAFHNQMVWTPEALAGSGIQAVSDEVGETVVTGNNTVKYTGYWYGLVGGRITLIFEDNATATFDSPTQFTATHTISVYVSAIADLDKDGFPDPGSTPVTTISSTSFGKRVGR